MRQIASMYGMNRGEAADIVHAAATAWPIKTDRATIDVWAVALTGTNHADARLALRQLVGVRKTIHPSDVVKRAKQLRDELIRTLPEFVPPAELVDQPRLYIEWQRTARERALVEAREQRDREQLLLPA